MELTNKTLALAVNDPTAIGSARRSAQVLARQQGFDEIRQGQLAIIVTEASRNLVQHAGGGSVLLRALAQDEHRGVEMLALDCGPGVANVSQALQDGFSTGGTPGTGLGAIQRLANEFDIYTIRGQGTAVLARLWAKAAPELPSTAAQFGAVCVARVGETRCGDSWAIRLAADRVVLLVVDGLGHGERAAEAADLAVEIFLAGSLSGAALMGALHQQLQRTRGAALAFAEILWPERTIDFWGVGNVSGSLLPMRNERLSMVSLHGTVGMELPRLRSFRYPWPAGGLMVLHTDGLTSRWTLIDYPGIMHRDPALVAGLLYRDFQRGRDDATIVVLRAPATPAALGA